MRKQDGTPADPLDIGAGLMDLAAAGRVGLVLDESYADMLAANPSTGGSPRALNVPYLVNRQRTLICSWTRDVTSVAGTSASYTASVAAPAGMTATVEPAAFTLAPGATQQLTITVDVRGSSGGDWVFADLRLATGDHHAGGAAIANVHYPMAVIPTALEWSLGEAPVVADGAALADLDPGRRELPRNGVLLVPNTAVPGVAAFGPETGDLLDPAFITYPQSLGTTTHIILNAARTASWSPPRPRTWSTRSIWTGSTKGCSHPSVGPTHRSWATSAEW